MRVQVRGKGPSDFWALGPGTWLWHLALWLLWLQLGRWGVTHNLAVRHLIE